MIIHSSQENLFHRYVDEPLAVMVSGISKLVAVVALVVVATVVVFIQ